MTANREVKQLLLILNIKAEKDKTNYVLSYNYMYNPKFKKVFCRTKITKYVSNIITDYIHIGADAKALEYLANEIKRYSKE